MSLFEDPEVGAAPEPTFSVTELADRIGNALRAAFRDEVWVRGEIRDLSRPSSGPRLLHAHRAGRRRRSVPRRDAVVAQQAAREPRPHARRWRGAHGRRHRGPDPRAARLVRPAGQLQLRMSAIDPSYTLGQLEVARAALIARLTEEGLLRANAARAMPLVPLRVGLVTSAGSAAEADFLDELRRSGFAFDVVIDRQPGPGTGGAPGAGRRARPGRRPRGSTSSRSCGAAGPARTSWPSTTSGWRGRSRRAPSRPHRDRPRGGPIGRRRRGPREPEDPHGLRAGAGGPRGRLRRPPQRGVVGHRPPAPREGVDDHEERVEQAAQPGRAGRHLGPAHRRDGDSTAMPDGSSRRPVATSAPPRPAPATTPAGSSTGAPVR